MKNIDAISIVARQIIKACESIENVCCNAGRLAAEGRDVLSDTFDGICFDELEHIQRLTLEMTVLMTEDVDNTVANSDEADGGSVFGPGELTDTKPEEVEGNPEV